MLKKLCKLFKIDYQSMLEIYITARNPKSEADVERLTREFERKLHTNY